MQQQALDLGDFFAGESRPEQLDVGELELAGGMRMSLLQFDVLLLVEPLFVFAVDVEILGHLGYARLTFFSSASLLMLMIGILMKGNSRRNSSFSFLISSEWTSNEV